MLHGFNSFHNTQPDHRVVALPVMVKKSSVMNTHMTGASTTPKKLIFKETWIAWLNVWNCSPIFLFLISNSWGLFSVLVPSELFFVLGSGSKTFVGPTYVDHELWFRKYNPIFLFLIRPYFRPLLHFFGPSGKFFCPLRLFWGIWVRFKKIFLEPTNVDYQFLFRKCSPSFCFESGQIWGLFAL